MIAMMTLLCMGLQAQDVKEKSFTLLERDLYPRVHERLDMNGEPCAVVKVSVPKSKSFVFEGNIIGEPIYTPGEVIVYLCGGTKSLDIKSDDYGSISYKFPQTIKKQVSYKLTLKIEMTNEQRNKVLEKRIKREYKVKMKEYEKAGWKHFGSSRSLEVALLSHYDKLRELGDEGTELVGIASRFRSKNVGKQMAANSACVTYAQQAGSYVKGRVVSELQGNGIEPTDEIDKFYAAYERLVEKEIKGEMSESYTIVRDLKDGTYEMQVFYIIDTHKASEARIRAFEDAMKEEALSQQQAEMLSGFIREGFDD